MPCKHSCAYQNDSFLNEHLLCASSSPVPRDYSQGGSALGSFPERLRSVSALAQGCGVCGSSPATQCAGGVTSGESLSRFVLWFSHL